MPIIKPIKKAVQQPIQSQVSQVVIDTAGLISHWKFNTSSPLDSQGSFDATLQNGATYGTDQNSIANNCLSTDGVNDRADIDGILASIGATTIGSWTLWINPVDATPATTEELLTFSNSADGTIIVLSIQTDGKVKSTCNIAGNSKWKVVTDSVVLSNGVWAHLGLVMNGIIPILYIDGIAVAQTITVTTDTTIWLNDGTFNRGRISNLNFIGSEVNFFDGLTDDVRVYNLNKTASEMLAIKNEGV